MVLFTVHSTFGLDSAQRSGTELKLHESPIVDVQQLRDDMRDDLLSGPVKANHGKPVSCPEPFLQHGVGMLRAAPLEDDDPGILHRHWHLW